MKLRSKERIENNSKILILSLTFVFAFMVILIPLVNKGTHSMDTGEILYGDVNLDGEITNKDRFYLARSLSNMEGYQLSEAAKGNADVNMDGKVDDTDLTILIRYLAKWTGYDELPYTGNVKTDALTLTCPDSSLGDEEVECLITLDVISIVTQGLALKYILPEGVEYVGFDTDSFEIESSDQYGVVLVNLDGVSGENISVGKLKLKMPTEAIPDTEYKVELVDSTMGDGEETVIELENIFYEIRIKSDVNTLDSITLSDGVLNEEFDKDTLKYTATTDSEKIIISAEATSEYAAISGDVDVEKELHYGTNKLNIVVTSEDGTEKTYEISVFRNYDFDTTMYLYNKNDNYIYVGNDVDNLLDNIEVADGLEKTLDKENELLIISYEDEILLEIDVLSINFKKYLLSNNTLYVDKEELKLEEFLSNVDYSNGIEFELTENEILVNYNDSLLGAYNVEIYSLSFDINLNVDEEKFYINNLDLGTTVSELLEKIIVIGGNVNIYNIDDEKKESDNIIASGDLLRVYLGDNLMAEYSLSVLGDSNGDGKLSTIDLAQFRKHLVDWINPKTGIEFELDGVYSNAFDLNKDGRISVTDLALMRKKIVGVS